MWLLNEVCPSRMKFLSALPNTGRAEDRLHCPHPLWNRIAQWLTQHQSDLARIQKRKLLYLTFRGKAHYIAVELDRFPQILDAQH